MQTKSLAWRCSPRAVLLLFVALAAAPCLHAQSKPPLRLAIIAQTSEASDLLDILTAELSSRGGIQLLERGEIDRILREQGLSAANQDDLKLGRILGADGVIVLSCVSQVPATPQFLPFGQSRGPKPKRELAARLVAVQPGVVLGEMRGVCPAGEVVSWGKFIAARFALEFPKLGVLAKDAIPISVVNLRSAVNSPEGRETERQLTLLAIARLARERNLFVLERQRMDLLGKEKEFNGNESPFWSGKYLLEGVVDQNGYSKGRITVDARLTPPNGGAPMTFEAAGSRTNLTEVANQLALEVARALNLSAPAREWKPADEAGLFFDEAKWALRWHLTDQAQAAAESAWALGRHDLDCAILRVKSCLVPPDYYRSQRGSIRYALGVVTPSMAAAKPPTVATAQCEQRALDLYLELGRNLAPDQLTPASAWCRLGVEALTAASRVLQHFYLVPKARESAARNLEDLRGSARAVAAWLAGLPAVRNSYFVGNRLVKDDEVRQIFEVNSNVFLCELNCGSLWQERPEDTLALYRDLMRGPLFVCIHSHLWFRNPYLPRLLAWNGEDQKRLPAAWRGFLDELSGSTNCWFRFEAKALEFADARSRIGAPIQPKSPQTPEAKAILKRYASRDTNAPVDPELLKQLRSLNALPAKEIQSVKAARDQQLEAAADALFDFISANYDRLVAENQNLLYGAWDLNSFFERGGTITAATEKLDKRFKTEYSSRFAALRTAYLAKNGDRVKEKEHRVEFEKQKQYLANNTPYNFHEFCSVFSYRDYTRGQALELRPLAEAYGSNLVARAAGKSMADQAAARAAVSWVGLHLGRAIDTALNPEAHPHGPIVITGFPPPQAGLNPVGLSQPGPGLPRFSSRPSISPGQPQGGQTLGVIGRRPAHQGPSPGGPAPSSAPVTNALLVTDYFPLPRKSIGLTNITFANISGSRWCEGRLLLTLWCQGRFAQYALTSQGATAIFDPQTRAWDLVPTPRKDSSPTLGSMPGGLPFGYRASQNRGAYSILFQDRLYLSDGGQIRAFDFRNRQWHTVDAPEDRDCRLFAFDGHLYAAGEEAIFEILDQGRGTKILASTRRRPAASALDSLATLGSPMLFSRPGQPLCVGLKHGLFAWNGNDWAEFCPLNPSTASVEVFDDATLFRCFPSFQPPTLWMLRKSQSQLELCLREKLRPLRGIPGGPAPKPELEPAQPLWNSLETQSLVHAPVAMLDGGLVFLTLPGGSFAAPGPRPLRPGVSEQLNLVCLRPGRPEAVVFPLKFATQAGSPPFSSTALARGIAGVIWMQVADGSLLFGKASSLGVWSLPVSRLRKYWPSKVEAQYMRTPTQAIPHQ